MYILWYDAKAKIIDTEICDCIRIIFSTSSG